ncbi:hypothetical protein PMI06_003349 [Burkholderia sp. BT03]|nr:hypothetical protein PMI06_003349 [Burkholderia sp. BT03]SKC77061.1 hypothetical protein SAMN06266956_3014 [Paraburkholderia hospita]
MRTGSRALKPDPGHPSLGASLKVNRLRKALFAIAIGEGKTRTVTSFRDDGGRSSESCFGLRSLAICFARQLCQRTRRA